MRKKKIKIQIKSIWGNVLFEYKCVDNTLKTTLKKAINQGAYLRGADLQGAYLQRAYLQGAYLQGAYLQGADLRGADLRGADLRGADLQRAYLQGAYLQGADLRGADLQRAYLQGAYLQGAYLQRADLRGAYLRGADLQGAYLQRAYLQGAYLQGAYLQGADLRGADLQGAYLQGAYLQRADLRGAKNLQPIYFSEIYNLKLLPKTTKLRMWKYLINGKSPYQSAIYEVDKIYKVKKFDTDENIECSKGLNVSTLTWCLRDSMGKENIELIEVEFKVSDIVAIPYWTDGKFRVKRFKVLRKISREEGMDLMYKISGFKKDKNN